MMRRLARLLIRGWWMLFLVACSSVPVGAHPMGNFSINHYARFEAKPGLLRLRYILDFAEIPTAQRLPQLDTDGDSAVSAAEKAAYLKVRVPQFLAALQVSLDGTPQALTAASGELELRPGAGGLDTLRVTMEAPIPTSRGAGYSVSYRDGNFAGRTGWMEVLALGSGGCAIKNSDVGEVDRSRGLTVFPLNAGIVPPLQSSATFTVTAPGVTAGAPSPAGSNLPGVPPGFVEPATSATNNQTPQNRFTQSIAQGALSPALVLWGVVFALAFGAAHALSPGHGKTMVAAYLVGSRGTTRHAVLLGLVVTITHTLGVFLLGLALLLASDRILPEKLFPFLSAASGLMIFGVGLWLLITRWQGLAASRANGHDHHHDHDDHGHDHGHDHDHDFAHHHDHDQNHGHGRDDGHGHVHTQDEGYVDGRSHDCGRNHDCANSQNLSHGDALSYEPGHSHVHVHSHEPGHGHEPGHSRDHDHDHGNGHGMVFEGHVPPDHALAHDQVINQGGFHGHPHGHNQSGLVHSHGGRVHSHDVPEGPLNLRTLVMLGISGGIVPCPEALVVLLAAVKLHRVGYGMVLISAFSIGLAAALIAIGLLVVSARQRLSLMGGLGAGGVLTRYLPIGSAAFITAIGIVLTLRSVGPLGP